MSADRYGLLIFVFAVVSVFAASFVHEATVRISRGIVAVVSHILKKDWGLRILLSIYYYGLVSFL